MVRTCPIRSSRLRGALAAGVVAAVALVGGGLARHLPVHAAASSPGPLAASLVAAAPAQVGVQETLTYTATNTTATDISLVTVVLDGTDDTVTLAFLPESVHVVQPATLSCILHQTECVLSGPLAPGASVVLTISFIPTSLDTLDTTVGIVGDVPGMGLLSNPVDLVSTVSPGPTDVQVTGSASTGSPARGAIFSYTFQVKNNGPLPAYAVSFSDPLPAEVGFSSVQTSVGSCLQAAGTVSCALGDLAVGAQANIVITVVAPTSPATFINTASVTTASPDRQPSNNSVGVTVQVK
jgi:uncharacterized repeat protein (TIGR01451 family)